MPQACAHCGSETDDDQAACFICGQSLQLPIRLGELIASRYEIRSRLGRGGMGAVYRAYDRVLEEDVALKVLREGAGEDRDATRRFRTEIKLARRVIHRNVCRIFEYGEEQGRRFISMELVDGLDLKQVLSQELPEPGRAFGVAIQVAEGLEAIHHVGVIHRDLKASNIMLDKSGTVRLMDFGIAKHVTQDTVGATATGHIVGTPAYMSPEQARGERLDFRSDIYSLGVVIYELFTGQVPFEGETPVAVILRHIHEPPPLAGPRANRIPANALPILSRALAKSRDERFQSTAEMAQALRAAAGSGLPPQLPRGMAMGGPTGPTLPGGPAAERAWQAPTQVGAPTREADGRMAEAPAPQPTRTVLMRDGRPQRRLGLAAVVGALALAALAAGGFLLRLRPERADPSPSPTAQSPEPVAAPVRARVSLNALPWARATLKSVEAGKAAPGDRCITPCSLELPEGSYAVELENGGLTPPLSQEIRIVPGASNQFVFTMPSFDPARAARLAVERRP